jgi:hypothetical protein
VYTFFEYKISHTGGWNYNNVGMNVHHDAYVRAPGGGAFSNFLFNDKTIFIARYTRGGRWKIGVWDYRYGDNKRQRIEWDFNDKPSCGAYWHNDRYRILCINPRNQVIVKEYVTDT